LFDFIARLFGHHRTADLDQFRDLFERFQQILKGNNRILELISELEDKLGGEYIFDINYLKHVTGELSESVYLVSSSLNVISDNRYYGLFDRQMAIQKELERILRGEAVRGSDSLTMNYEEIDADLVEIVGGKNANLGEMKNRFKMPVPDGFAVTTNAYRRFMEHNRIWPEIHRIRKDLDDGIIEDAAGYDRTIDELFRKAAFPTDVVRSIERAIESIGKGNRSKRGLAVRSSAYGEDSPRRSFAGQFESFLNCPAEEVIPACIKVMASRFKHRVLAYAGEAALDEARFPMAIGIQQMIDAEASGVAYSVDPSGEYPEHIVLSACPGLGIPVVSGEGETDSYKISRLDTGRIIERQIGHKTTQTVFWESGGITKKKIDKQYQDAACLEDKQVIEVAERVLMLDRYFNRPVDVEWCYDRAGGFHVLQCRPLVLSSKSEQEPFNRAVVLADKTVLMKKQGQVAQRGIAVGRVRQVHEGDDARDFPVGAIVVTKYTTPRLSEIVRKASAIVTDVGSASGHMATIAREFCVPMIVNTGHATELLTEGSELTVDAEENVIYAGVVKELLAYGSEAEDMYRDLKEYYILRRLLKRISPLHLIDPNSPEFTVKNCLTYHDIGRFSHEKAVRILIDLNISSRRFRGVESRELKLNIPLGLHVIDLGGGLDTDDRGNKIESLERIKSLPMKSMLLGLVAPGAWSTQPLQLGFSDLVSSLTRFSMTARGASYQGQNLAVISDNYANISLRLGYHFNVIDTYVSENVDDNYIYFRFVGGVTETERRHLRAMLIKVILEKLNFRVTLSGDLVVARLKKVEKHRALDVLREIGRLIGFTRQLDTQMQSEQSIAELSQAFFQPPHEAM